MISAWRYGGEDKVWSVQPETDETDNQSVRRRHTYPHSEPRRYLPLLHEHHGCIGAGAKIATV
jgi:hypothetical protein